MSSSSSKKKRSVGGGNDAFALLMGRGGTTTGTGSGGKKRRRATTAVAAAASPGGTGSGSRYIECPACLRNVIFERLNAHLDSGCVSNLPSPPPKSQSDAVAMAPVIDEPLGKASTSSGVGSDVASSHISEEATTSAIRDNRPNTKVPEPGREQHEEKQNPITNLSSESTSSNVKPASNPVNSDISISAGESKSESKCKPKSGINDGGVFAKMMARSQEVFASKSAVTHYFHLHDANGKVTWTDTNRDCNRGGVNTYWGDATSADPATATEGGDASGESVAPFISGETTNEYLKAVFSETIRIRPIKAKQNVDLLTHGRDIDLVISSSVPGATLSKEKGFGLVKRHSRLSVPVLKSMLQKNIRRRRPLPAVRVAMELADKSYGDLVRRIPIMVLEDSILHPDFPLLVWLMVAESKGFKPTQQLMTKLMRIVFEVASCPMKDPLPPDNMSADDSENGGEDDTDLADALGPDCEMMLRAMLLRVSYGGMKCDTEMLVQYEQLWRKRFHAQMEGPDVVALHTQDPEALSQTKARGEASTNFKTTKLDATAHVTMSGGNPLQILWSDLPAHSHEKAAAQSGGLVPNLITVRLEKLSPSDAIHNGVDFHCSAVLETVLSDKSIAAAIAQRMVKTSVGNAPEEGEDKAEAMMNIAKLCMWRYSSGVNHKRDLSSMADANVANTNDKDKQLKELWEEFLSKPAKDYTSRYVSSRLIL